jgi:lipopolysaccharide/colanic/teichoic acid biosynthesis glycosyltransferase
MARTSTTEDIDIAGPLAARPEFVPSLRSTDSALRQIWREKQPPIELTATIVQGWPYVAKRVIDVVGSGVGLILLSPLFGLIAVLIRVESPGSAIFTQSRVGRRARVFKILKFRTMVDKAEKRRDELLPLSLYSDARLFKVRDDPRLTRMGRLLRRTSLDELPQLVNVLRGEMSLVGPRPPLPSEVALYEERHYGRFDVMPGITGPWQVGGRNDITEFERVVALEAEYIQGWSLWRDLGILFRTIPVVITGRGAH